MNYHLVSIGLALALCTCLLERAAAQQASGFGPASALNENQVGATLTAKLIDAEQKAQKKSATISVYVRELKIVDPGSVNEKAVNGQGHLHYQLDNGPIIATTATKLSFHELSSGPHSITVALAGNNHAPLGPSATLTITVP